MKFTQLQIGKTYLFFEDEIVTFLSYEERPRVGTCVRLEHVDGSRVLWSLSLAMYFLKEIDMSFESVETPQLTT